MFYLILLVIFLIQFLVVLAALIFALFMARPEVPLSADAGSEKAETEDGERKSAQAPEEKDSATGKGGSWPSNIAAFAVPSRGILYESAPEWYCPARISRG
jgi:flagellar biosynthesis/type III secretory pathway M-ring protein FliF/YscJ